MSGGGALTSDITLSSTTWAASSSNIFNLNSGNVGIGTFSPTHKLEVRGSFDTANGLVGINSGVGVTGDVTILTGSATGSLVMVLPNLRPDQRLPEYQPLGRIETDGNISTRHHNRATLVDH